MYDLKYLSNCQQITFIMLNRFCLLSKPPPPLFLNRQNQDGWNTNQNQMKNTHSFYIVFEVLKVLYIIICKIQLLDLLFLVLCQILHHQISSFNRTLSEKFFVTNFPFSTDSLKPSP